MPTVLRKTLFTAGSEKSCPVRLNTTVLYLFMVSPLKSSVVVQRLGYLAFTQETRVRFPATESLFLIFFLVIFGIRLFCRTAKSTNLVGDDVQFLLIFSLDICGALNPSEVRYVSSLNQRRYLLARQWYAWQHYRHLCVYHSCHLLLQQPPRQRLYLIPTLLLRPGRRTHRRTSESAATHLLFPAAYVIWSRKIRFWVEHA